MKKLMILLIFVVFCLTASSDVFAWNEYFESKNTDFFTFKQGYSVAYEEVKRSQEEIYDNENLFGKLKDPVLVLAWCRISSIYTEFVFPENTSGLDFIAVDSISVSGSTLGKANVWYYVFAEREYLGDSNMIITSVIKLNLPFGIEKYYVDHEFIYWNDDNDFYSPWVFRYGPAHEIPTSEIPITTTTRLKKVFAMQPIELEDIKEDSDVFFKRVYKGDFADSAKRVLYNDISAHDDQFMPLAMYIGTLAQYEYGLPIEPNRPAWVAKAYAEYRGILYPWWPGSGKEYPRANKTSQVCYEYLDTPGLNCGTQTSILEEYSLSDANLYPNPAQKTVNIYFTLTHWTDKLQITVKDILGQTQLSTTKNGSYERGEQSIQLNVEELSMGTYYVIIEIGSHIITQPLVIAR